MACSFFQNFKNHDLISFERFNHFKTMMQIREIIKVKHPKTAVIKDTFNPPAIIAGEAGALKSSIASNASIIPITEPKTPITRPKRPDSPIRLKYFLNLKSFVFKASPDFRTKKMDNKRHIRIRLIIKGPPSLKRSTNGLLTKKINLIV